MHFVMFILGIVCLLVGLLFLFQDKSSDKTSGTIAMGIGIVLLILGSDLSQRVQNVKVASMEVSFAAAPASLTPQQVDGAQKAQQIRLAPPTVAAANTTGATPIASFSTLLALAQRRSQEQTATLHQALAAQGFTPAPDPFVDLSPGTIVRVSPDGKVAVQFTRQAAFPQLKVQASTFDFMQFTSLGGTKAGFNVVGVFTCEQGFRENMDLVTEVFTPVAPVADALMRVDPTLHAVRSVLGCYGREKFFLLNNTAPTPPGPQKRYILGFQLATTIRR